jgi:hypothetical protein
MSNRAPQFDSTEIVATGGRFDIALGFPGVSTLAVTTDTNSTGRYGLLPAPGAGGGNDVPSSWTAIPANSNFALTPSGSNRWRFETITGRLSVNFTAAS